MVHRIWFGILGGMLIGMVGLPARADLIDQRKIERRLNFSSGPLDRELAATLVYSFDPYDLLDACEHYLQYGRVEASKSTAALIWVRLQTPKGVSEIVRYLFSPDENIARAAADELRFRYREVVGFRGGMTEFFSGLSPQDRTRFVHALLNSTDETTGRTAAGTAKILRRVADGNRNPVVGILNTYLFRDRTPKPSAAEYAAALAYVRILKDLGGYPEIWPLLDSPHPYISRILVDELRGLLSSRTAGFLWSPREFRELGWATKSKMITALLDAADDSEFHSSAIVTAMLVLKMSNEFGLGALVREYQKKAHRRDNEASNRAAEMLSQLLGKSIFIPTCLMVIKLARAN